MDNENDMFDKPERSYTPYKGFTLFFLFLAETKKPKLLQEVLV
jgi:hypothetical protein